VVKIQFSTDNAAFEDNGREEEIARILRRIADKIESGAVAGTARDSNGNRVGTFEVAPD
jgi:hypothetical protein